MEWDSLSWDWESQQCWSCQYLRRREKTVSKKGRALLASWDNPILGACQGLLQANDLTSSPLSSVPSLSVTSRCTVVVCVGTGPLEVDTFVLCNGHSVRNEVVLDSWISLYNVPTLPTHIQVVDGASLGVLVGHCSTWAEQHDVGAVLEGTAKLGSVDGQSEWLVGGGADVHVGVLLDR